MWAIQHSVWPIRCLWWEQRLSGQNLPTGVQDGNHKIFTGFRCWMPSKQQFAYDWIMSYAIPTLIGKKTTLRIKVISSDAENALIKAMNGNINHSNGYYDKTKSRYDFYHLVKQPWCKFICTCNHDITPTCHKMYESILCVITSWFNYTESSKEYQTSYKQLEIFMDSLRSFLREIFYLDANC